MGGILIAVVLGGALHLDLRRSQLTRLRAELKSRGFKLTAVELAGNRRGSPKDMAGLAEADAELQRLPGHIMGQLSVMQFDSSGAPRPVIKPDRPFAAASDLTLTNWTWEDLARVMESAQPALQKVRTLVHQDVPYSWLGTNPSVFGLIDMALWLEADAVTQLRQRSRTAALDDLESLTDLALVGYGEKDIIVAFGRAAAVRIGLKTAWEILLSGPWTEADLKRTATAWERVWPLQAFEAGAEGELTVADEMESELHREAAQGPWRDRLAAVVGEFDSAEDARFLLEWALAHWDAARLLERGQSWQSIRTDLEALESVRFAKTRSRWRHLGLRLCLPKINDTFENCARSEAARQLLLADVAIRRFKLQHGGPVPKTLRELTPEFLSPASGHDVFGGGDLKYHANPDGSYTLYSVGLDGVDDGGDDSVSGGKQRFWESRDMVWPSDR
jgi:hypothetical protein